MILKKKKNENVTHNIHPNTFPFLLPFTNMFITSRSVPTSLWGKNFTSDEST